MKKLINDVAAVVPETLAGMAALDPGLVLTGGNVLVRSDARDPAVLSRVALVSGGGSGHEPAHAGYVGPGMLSAAVAGEVFTSPSTDAVLAAVRAVGGPAGVLLVVKNYTGDRLNFGLAAETARAEGLAVEVVVVADDVALPADGPHAGRRGLAGTVLVHKVAGAAAAEGLPLAEVAAVARATADRLGTMGVALGSCTVPAAGSPGFALGADEVEWGLGIHGEPGVRRGPLLDADGVVAELLGAVVADRGLGAGRRVALLVGNLGGSAVGEIALVAGSAVAWLRARGLVVERAWAGSFLTALEMPGCSLTLLEVDDDTLRRLDAPTRAPAWPVGTGRVAAAGRPDPVPDPEPAGPGLAASPLRRVLEAVAAALVAAEPELTAMDQRVGDGDLGDSLARGSRAVLSGLDAYPAADRPAEVLRAVSATVRRVVGGTSGPLYAVLLVRAAAALGSTSPSPQDWAGAFRAGVAGVRDLGGAAPGDRTMVDALEPAADALDRALAAGRPVVEALDEAVVAARAGTAATAGMVPRLGRSSYVGARALGEPDPGAHAVALWLGAVRDALG